MIARALEDRPWNAGPQSGSSRTTSSSRCDRSRATRRGAARDRDRRPLWHHLLGAKDPDAIDVAIKRLSRLRARPDQRSRDAFKRVCDVYAEVGDTQASLPQHCPIRLAHAEWRLGERAILRGALRCTLMRSRAWPPTASDGLSPRLVRRPRPLLPLRLREWHVELAMSPQAFALTTPACPLAPAVDRVPARDDGAAILPAEELRDSPSFAPPFCIWQEAAHEPRSSGARRDGDRDARFRELVAAREALKQRYPRYAALAQPVWSTIARGGEAFCRNTPRSCMHSARIVCSLRGHGARPPLVVDLGARADRR